RKKRQGGGQQPQASSTQQITPPALANKRYLILTYNAEYDRIYYPLSLPYCGKPDPVLSMNQIRELIKENRFYKTRLESNVQHSDFIRLQRDLTRLRKENDQLKQQLTLYRSGGNGGGDNQPINNSSANDKQQIELLRQMIRSSEEALSKERNRLHKTTSKKLDDYRILTDQVDSLRTSERQLKAKVRSLTNEIGILKRNSVHRSPVVKPSSRSSSKERPMSNGYSPRSRISQRPPSRPNSGDRRRQQQQPLHSQHRSDHVLIKQRHRSLSSERNHRSTSSTKQRSPSPSDSQKRFNPTAYIRERNNKLREFELQK
ncbi:unnamed protein product, partial [Didymodactylos carnosus]